MTVIRQLLALFFFLSRILTTRPHSHSTVSASLQEIFSGLNGEYVEDEDLVSACAYCTVFCLFLIDDRLYIAILCSWADSLRLHVVLHDWLAFHSAFSFSFLNIHRSGVLKRWHGWCHMKLLLSQRKFCVHHEGMDADFFPRSSQRRLGNSHTPSIAFRGQLPPNSARFSYTLKEGCRKPVLGVWVTPPPWHESMLGKPVSPDLWLNQTSTMPTRAHSDRWMVSSTFCLFFCFICFDPFFRVQNQVHRECCWFNIYRWSLLRRLFGLWKW